MSADWKELERRIRDVTKSRPRPVAVTFLDAEPVNIEKFEGSEPSSRSFWRLAADGRTFYTVPENHFNCAVGTYTHNTVVGGQAGRGRANIKDDVRSGRCKAGRSAEDTAPRERVEGDLVCAARRSPCDTGCGFSRMQASGSNVARGSCGPGGPRDGYADARKADLHGAACRVRTRNDHEPRLHREPGVHRTRKCTWSCEEKTWRQWQRL
jgi:hypothetical protein